MVLCYLGRFLEAIIGVIWDVFLDTNWDVNLDANWDGNCDANWDVNQDANQHPKQCQIFKRDTNNTIKTAFSWKIIHFVQKMMKNTLKVIVDAEKEA